MPDYRRYHVNIGLSYLDEVPNRVLIIGCNHGEECPLFLEQGVGQITGIDIHAETGRDFKNERVHFLRAVAERLPFADGSFDFVFCHATMEHVHGIEAAFGEMVRVCAPRGVIYSVAAPLWHCRCGPHWADAYDDDPWPHLRYSPDQIVNIGQAKLDRGFQNQYFGRDQILYCLSDEHFNKRRVREYMNACMCLDGIEVVANQIDLDRFSAPTSVLQELVAKGYDYFDIFGVTHTFVARRL